MLLTISLDLTGISIAETIMGIQDAGVIACAKHFIGNEQAIAPFSIIQISVEEVDLCG